MKVIFKLILVIDVSFNIDLKWMSPDLTDDTSTLVQVMAWCHQAPCHYMSQYWPRSMSPYGVTRPQGVELTHYVTLFWACSTNWFKLGDNNCSSATKQNNVFLIAELWILVWNYVENLQKWRHYNNRIEMNNGRILQTARNTKICVL